MTVVVIVSIVMVMIAIGGWLARRLVSGPGSHGVLMPGIWFQAAKKGVCRWLSVDQRSDRWDLLVRLKFWSRRQRLAHRVFVFSGLFRCGT